MALASFPASPERPRSVPPPLPVSLRLEAEPWSSLPKNLILDLRNRLTNNEGRDDRKDDGRGAGSLFRELIDDYNMGIISGHEWWAITVWPSSSFWRGPVAWMLLRPEPRYLPTLRVGTYTDPSWRNRGLGKLLNNEAMRVGHQQGYKRLVASPWNKRSDAFFRAAGYAVLCPYGGGLSALAELDIPEECPARLPWRCRPPENA